MTEREKLIELIRQAKTELTFYTSDGEPVTKVKRSIVDFAEAKDLADHLLANGVIVPPCKVGDTVYKVINDKRVKKPYECIVVGFWYSADERCNNAHLVRYVQDVFDCSFSVPLTDFGKTVFLTKEEAEKALKERSEGK